MGISAWVALGTLAGTLVGVLLSEVTRRWVSIFFVKIETSRRLEVTNRDLVEKDINRCKSLIMEAQIAISGALAAVERQSRVENGFSPLILPGLRETIVPVDSLDATIIHVKSVSLPLFEALNSSGNGLRETGHHNPKLTLLMNCCSSLNAICLLSDRLMAFDLDGASVEVRLRHMRKIDEYKVALIALKKLLLEANRSFKFPKP